MNLIKQPKLSAGVTRLAGKNFNEHSTMPAQTRGLAPRQPATKSTGPAFELTFELTIDELVLNGFSPRDRFHIADAMERELSALLSEKGIPGLHGDSVSAESLDAGKFNVLPGARAHVIGK